MNDKFNDSELAENKEVKTETSSTTVSDTASEDKIELSYLQKDFVLDCMSVPTESKSEIRMVTFIMLWAQRNKIKYEFDSYGNIYLTKGELSEGEYYPCVTSHLDTVQTKHGPYISAGGLKRQ